MKTIPASVKNDMDIIRATNAIAEKNREREHRELQEAVDAYSKTKTAPDGIR